MIKEMMIRCGIIIAGLIATEAVLEKVERAALNRENGKKKYSGKNENGKKLRNKSIRLNSYEIEVTTENGDKTNMTVIAANREDAIRKVSNDMPDGYSITNTRKL